MFEVFGVPSQALFGQLLLGLINGSFYALLSLGLAVIFGMLNIINFSHGAQYMLGAFVAYLLLQGGANFDPFCNLLPSKLGVVCSLFFHQLPPIPYWGALIIAPILVALTGIAIERLFLKHLYK